jgi:hypothetical protein
VLVVAAVGFASVLGIAMTLRPYEEDGTPKTMATHTQLNLPSCNFIALTGKPCPTCGMTTSFAHLVRGNLWSSLRANWVGTLLAVYSLAIVPWAAYSAYTGRLWRIRNGEALVSASLGIFTVLMLLRYVFVWLL